MKNAKGIWTVTNTAGIELLDIEHGIEDVATIRFQDVEFEEVIRYDENGEAFIMWGECEYYFNECLRVA